MNDYGRCLVVDLEFDAAVSEAQRALDEEGLQLIARIDVRDRFRQDLGHDFRRYVLLEAWSPQQALEALRHDLNAGTILPTTIACYELADGETAVVAKASLSPMQEEPDWRQEASDLAVIADREAHRVARALERLQHAVRRLHRLQEDEPSPGPEPLPRAPCRCPLPWSRPAGSAHHGFRREHEVAHC